MSSPTQAGSSSAAATAAATHTTAGASTEIDSDAALAAQLQEEEDAHAAAVANGPMFNVAPTPAANLTGKRGRDAWLIEDDSNEEDEDEVMTIDRTTQSHSHTRPESTHSSTVVGGGASCSMISHTSILHQSRSPPRDPFSSTASAAAAAYLSQLPTASIFAATPPKPSIMGSSMTASTAAAASSSIPILSRIDLTKYSHSSDESKVASVASALTSPQITKELPTTNPSSNPNPSMESSNQSQPGPSPPHQVNDFEEDMSCEEDVGRDFHDHPPLVPVESAAADATSHDSPSINVVSFGRPPIQSVINATLMPPVMNESDRATQPHGDSSEVGPIHHRDDRDVDTPADNADSSKDESKIDHRTSSISPSPATTINDNQIPTTANSCIVENTAPVVKGEMDDSMGLIDDDREDDSDDESDISSIPSETDQPATNPDHSTLLPSPAAVAPRPMSDLVLPGVTPVSMDEFRSILSTCRQEAEQIGWSEYLFIHPTYAVRIIQHFSEVHLLPPTSIARIREGKYFPLDQELSGCLCLFEIEHWWIAWCQRKGVRLKIKEVFELWRPSLENQYTSKKAAFYHRTRPNICCFFESIQTIHPSKRYRFVRRLFETFSGHVARSRLLTVLQQLWSTSTKPNPFNVVQPLLHQRLNQLNKTPEWNDERDSSLIQEAIEIVRHALDGLIQIPTTQPSSTFQPMISTTLTPTSLLTTPPMLSPFTTQPITVVDMAAATAASSTLPLSSSNTNSSSGFDRSNAVHSSFMAHRPHVPLICDHCGALVQDVEAHLFLNQACFRGVVQQQMMMTFNMNFLLASGLQLTDPNALAWFGAVNNSTAITSTTSITNQPPALSLHPTTPTALTSQLTPSQSPIASSVTSLQASSTTTNTRSGTPQPVALAGRATSVPPALPLSKPKSGRVPSASSTRPISSSVQVDGEEYEFVNPNIPSWLNQLKEITTKPASKPMELVSTTNTTNVANDTIDRQPSLPTPTPTPSVTHLETILTPATLTHPATASTSTSSALVSPNPLSLPLTPVTYSAAPPTITPTNVNPTLTTTAAPSPPPAPPIPPPRRLGWGDSDASTISVTTTTVPVTPPVSAPPPAPTVTPAPPPFLWSWTPGREELFLRFVPASIDTPPDYQEIIQHFESERGEVVTAKQCRGYWYRFRKELVKRKYPPPPPPPPMIQPIETVASDTCEQNEERTNTASEPESQPLPQPMDTTMPDSAVTNSPNVSAAGSHAKFSWTPEREALFLELNGGTVFDTQPTFEPFIVQFQKRLNDTITVDQCRNHWYVLQRNAKAKTQSDKRKRAEKDQATAERVESARSLRPRSTVIQSPSTTTTNEPSEQERTNTAEREPHQLAPSTDSSVMNSPTVPEGSHAKFWTPEREALFLELNGGPVFDTLPDFDPFIVEFQKRLNLRITTRQCRNYWYKKQAKAKAKVEEDQKQRSVSPVHDSSPTNSTSNLDPSLSSALATRSLRSHPAIIDLGAIPVTSGDLKKIRPFNNEPIHHHEATTNEDDDDASSSHSNHDSTRSQPQSKRAASVWPPDLIPLLLKAIEQSRNSDTNRIEWTSVTNKLAESHIYRTVQQCRRRWMVWKREHGGDHSNAPTDEEESSTSSDTVSSDESTSETSDSDDESSSTPTIRRKHDWSKNGSSVWPPELVKLLKTAVKSCPRGTKCIDWIGVTNILRQAGHKRSVQQCQNKWHETKGTTNWSNAVSSDESESETSDSNDESSGTPATSRKRDWTKNFSSVWPPELVKLLKTAVKNSPRGSKLIDWMNVTEILRKAGYQRSVVQCHNKWQRLEMKGTTTRSQSPTTDEEERSTAASDSESHQLKQPLNHTPRTITPMKESSSSSTNSSIAADDSILSALHGRSLRSHPAPLVSLTSGPAIPLELKKILPFNNHGVMERVDQAKTILVQVGSNSQVESKKKKKRRVDGHSNAANSMSAVESKEQEDGDTMIDRHDQSEVDGHGNDMVDVLATSITADKTHDSHTHMIAEDEAGRELIRKQRGKRKYNSSRSTDDSTIQPLMNDEMNNNDMPFEIDSETPLIGTLMDTSMENDSPHSEPSSPTSIIEADGSDDDEEDAKRARKRLKKQKRKEKRKRQLAHSDEATDSINDVHPAKKSKRIQPGVHLLAIRSDPPPRRTQSIASNSSESTTDTSSTHPPPDTSAEFIQLNKSTIPTPSSSITSVPGSMATSSAVNAFFPPSVSTSTTPKEVLPKPVAPPVSTSSTVALPVERPPPLPPRDHPDFRRVASQHPCRYYFVQGDCRLGDRCWFSHDQQRFDQLAADQKASHISNASSSAASYQRPITNPHKVNVSTSDSTSAMSSTTTTPAPKHPRTIAPPLPPLSFIPDLLLPVINLPPPQDAVTFFSDGTVRAYVSIPLQLPAGADANTLLKAQARRARFRVLILGTIPDVTAVHLQHTPEAAKQDARQVRNFLLPYLSKIADSSVEWVRRSFRDPCGLFVQFAPSTKFDVFQWIRQTNTTLSQKPTNPTIQSALSPNELQFLVQEQKNHLKHQQQQKDDEIRRQHQEREQVRLEQIRVEKEKAAEKAAEKERQIQLAASSTKSRPIDPRLTKSTVTSPLASTPSSLQPSSASSTPVGPRSSSATTPPVTSAHTVTSRGGMSPTPTQSIPPAQSHGSHATPHAQFVNGPATGPHISSTNPPSQPHSVLPQQHQPLFHSSSQAPSPHTPSPSPPVHHSHSSSHYPPPSHHHHPMTPTGPIPSMPPPSVGILPPPSAPFKTPLSGIPDDFRHFYASLGAPPKRGAIIFPSMNDPRHDWIYQGGYEFGANESEARIRMEELTRRQFYLQHQSLSLTTKSSLNTNPDIRKARTIYDELVRSGLILAHEVICYLLQLRDDGRWLVHVSSEEMMKAIAVERTDALQRLGQNGWLVQGGWTPFPILPLPPPQPSQQPSTIQQPQAHIHPNQSHPPQKPFPYPHQSQQPSPSYGHPPAISNPHPMPVSHAYEPPHASPPPPPPPPPPSNSAAPWNHTTPRSGHHSYPPDVHHAHSRPYPLQPSPPPTASGHSPHTGGVYGTTSSSWSTSTPPPPPPPPPPTYSHHPTAYSSHPSPSGAAAIHPSPTSSSHYHSSTPSTGDPRYPPTTSHPHTPSRSSSSAAWRDRERRY